MHNSDRRVRGFGEVSIRAGNLEAIQDFYEATVGLEVLRREENFVFFRDAEGYGVHTQNLALLDSTERRFLENRSLGNDPGATTLHQIALNVALEEFEPERLRLEGLGLKVEATIHEWLHIRSLYFADPEGNLLEFVRHDETVR